MRSAVRAASRILASAWFLARIGTYSGSKSLSRSTPSLLLGRSMTWPFEASTLYPRPRNLLSVFDLVGDSTMTRLTPEVAAGSAAGAGLSRRAARGRAAGTGRAASAAGGASVTRAAPGAEVLALRAGRAAPERGVAAA